MNVRIHRGAHEVGGTCIEVESAGARIVLDAGQPLDVDRDVITPLPGVAGFQAPDSSLLGILISHGHQDHWGLVGQVPGDVPIFIGDPSRFRLEQEEAMTYAVLIEQGPTSFGATAPDLPGCVAVADTREEAERLIQEAIALHLKGMREDGLPVPRPTTQVATVDVA